MKKVCFEIELDGVITIKEVAIPVSIIHDFVQHNEYVRKYFADLGYTVGSYIRRC